MSDIIGSVTQAEVQKGANTDIGQSIEYIMQVLVETHCEAYFRGDTFKRVVGAALENRLGDLVEAKVREAVSKGLGGIINDTFINTIEESLDQTLENSLETYFHHPRGARLVREAVQDGVINTMSNTINDTMKEWVKEHLSVSIDVE